MKNILLLALLLSGFGISAHQSDSKVIAVISTAKWCPACQANGERVETEIVPEYAEDMRFKVLVYDQSDKETKSASKDNLKSEGLEDLLKDMKATGNICLVNAHSKELISSIAVSKSNDEIKTAFESALKETEM